MEYTEKELFALPTMVIADDCEIYRFNCTLLVSTNGQPEERVAKRRFYVDQLRGQGYIGFDAYNHFVDPKITDRIRITYIGKDFLYLFIRPGHDGKPTMHKVSFKDNALALKKDCGNGVVYTLVTTLKHKPDWVG